MVSDSSSLSSSSSYVSYHHPSTKTIHSILTKFTQENNVSVEFFPNKCVVKDLRNGQILMCGVERRGMYPLMASVMSCPTTAATCQSSAHSKIPQSIFKKSQGCQKSYAHVVSTDSLSLWHQRLGHPALTTVKDVLTCSSISFNALQNKTLCSACQYGKIHKLPFLDSTTVYHHPLQLVVIDLWGLAPIHSYGSVYYLSIVDTNVKLSINYLMLIYVTKYYLMLMTKFNYIVHPNHTLILILLWHGHFYLSFKLYLLIDIDWEGQASAGDTSLLGWLWTRRPTEKGGLGHEQLMGRASHQDTVPCCVNDTNMYQIGRAGMISKNEQAVQKRGKLIHLGTYSKIVANCWARRNGALRNGRRAIHSTSSILV